MGAIRQARLAIREARRSLPIPPESVRLNGQDAADRLDDVAELLHRYTAQLRRQADE